MIDRDPRGSQDATHDLVVIGGGVYGVCLALESVRRGLRPLLLERADFGRGTSAQTLRIIHGGLRYLQSLDLGRFRRSVEARRWWMKTFPGLVRPMPCLMPLHGRGLKRPGFLRIALLLSDILSRGRNTGLLPGNRIPGGRVVGPDEVMELFPGVNPRGLRGGALWHDGYMVSSQRLIIEMLRWVCAAGGSALNYVSARELLTVDGRIHGVRAVDELTGSSLEFAAPVVINAAGPAAEELVTPVDPSVPELFRSVVAFNALLRSPLPASVSVGVSPPSPSGSTYFLHPLGPLTFAGTVHAPWSDCGRDDPDAVDALLREFLGDLARAIPGFEPSMEDVVRVFCGELPASEEGSAETMKRPLIVDHETTEGPAGLFSVSGVKYTTAPVVAGAVLDLAFGEEPASTLDVDALRPPVRSWPRASRLAEHRGSLGAQLKAMLPGIREIVREEAVVCVEDLVLRRLDWVLADLDLEDVGERLGRLLPELPAATKPRVSRE